MTADARRRRRFTWIALVASVAAVVVTGVLGVFAVSSLADSQVGRDVGEDVVDSTRRLPWTATALIGVVDRDGVLASSVVGVLPPEGRGGVVVSVSPSADAAAGNGEVLRPLGSIFAVDGPEAWRAAMEQVTGLSFDVAQVVDPQGFAQLVTPLGELPTFFPFEMVDANSGRTFEIGADVLSSADAARAATARNATGPAWLFDQGRDAVWAAITDRVGAGIGSLPEGVRYDVTFPPRSLDQFVDAMFAAPVEFRALSAEVLDPERIAAQLPPTYASALGVGADQGVVTHPRGETVLVFASVAPARHGAPLAGPTVRLVSGFSDEDVAPLDMNRSDVLVATIDALLAAQANVVSVVDAPAAVVPERTQVLVADPTSVDAAWELYGDVFGEMQVIASPDPIDGVDVEVFLGRDGLSAATEPSPMTTDVAGSEP